MKTRFVVVGDEILMTGQVHSVPEADGVDLTFEEAVLVLVRSWQRFRRSTALRSRWRRAWSTWLCKTWSSGLWQRERW